MNRKLRVEELQRLSTEEYGKATKSPVTLVLDNIRSAYNVGSLFRTADCFRLKEIICCGITPTPDLKEVRKTAIGAEDVVPWKTLSLEETVAYTKSKGMSLWALEQTVDSVQLDEYNVRKDVEYALVLGNEVNGVSDYMISQAEGSIEIPQYGTKHSLNVANSASIAIWQFTLGFK